MENETSHEDTATLELEPEQLTDAEVAELIDSAYPTDSEVRGEVEISGIRNPALPKNEAEVFSELDQYINRIRDYPVLTRAEQRDLGQRVERGDLEAKNRFIECNLKLVVSYVMKNRQYWNRGLTVNELIQEGNIGMMRAVEKFDYRKGFKFSSIAVPWIDQGLRRGLANLGASIRIPVHQGERAQKIAAAHNRLTNELEREPTIEEVADASRTKPEHVRERRTRPLPRADISLNAPAGDDGAELGDFMTDPSQEGVDATLIRQSEQIDASRRLDHFTDEERSILGILIDHTNHLPDGRMITDYQAGSEECDRSPQELRGFFLRAIARQQKREGLPVDPDSIALDASNDDHLKPVVFEYREGVGAARNHRLDNLSAISRLLGITDRHANRLYQAARKYQDRFAA